jgi:hypothetical protein
VGPGILRKPRGNAPAARMVLATIYYHPSLEASGTVATSRLITIGRFNPVVDITLPAHLAARPDLVLFAPSYTFATPVLGGQASVLVLQGVDHARGGYTYFNPHTGNEFSAVLGFTYNFENPSTDYKNGTDMHLDLGVSKFLTKQLQIGAVGYAYQQITCDSGAGNRVGCFESRIFGLGPQIGYLFPLGEHYQGYLNLKGYKEFEAENRAEGWNVWLTFAISPAAPHEPPPARTPRVRK